MIRFTQITLRRGAKVLLEDADVSLNPGDKIGLIGANGTGKSSVFSMLLGELHADQGEVDYPQRWRVAHVAQETPALDRAAADGPVLFQSPWEFRPRGKSGLPGWISTHPGAEERARALPEGAAVTLSVLTPELCAVYGPL